MSMKQVWEMALDEWLAEPRTFSRQPRVQTLDEFRVANGYRTLLDDHGDFRHPNGLSKAGAKRKQERLNAKARDLGESTRAYEAASAAGTLPMITDTVEYLADGTDSQQTLAAMRVWHRTQCRQHQASQDTVDTFVHIIEHGGWRHIGA